MQINLKLDCTLYSGMGVHFHRNTHLRHKGWLSKALFHVKDEPSLHNSNAWREVSAYLHQFAPDLKRMDAIETSVLATEIEVAIPKIDHFSAWIDDFQNATYTHNTEIWFYTVGIFQASSFPNKTIDMPLIDSRILHWLNYQYDAPGYLHWGWNQWTGDPYMEAGRHLGDAWHVYPTKTGILNSVRWEQMRNGIQDYEYFWLLEDKISHLKDSLGSRFSWIDPKQRGKEIASNIILGLSEQIKDPVILYNSKLKVINELLELNTTPRIYVQVNPRENTKIENGTTIEIFGWTEPETKITINGQQIPVSNQGLFLENRSVSRRNTTITIMATNKDATKKIVREFVIK